MNFPNCSPPLLALPQLHWLLVASYCLQMVVLVGKVVLCFKSFILVPNVMTWQLACYNLARALQKKLG